MMCFRDRTFCPFYTTCTQGDSCHHALTGEIERQANAEGILISRFVEEPGCYVSIKGDEA